MKEVERLALSQCCVALSQVIDILRPQNTKLDDTTLVRSSRVLVRAAEILSIGIDNEEFEKEVKAARAKGDTA